MNNQPSQKDSLFLSFGIYSGIGFQLASAVVGGLLAGMWVDKKWNTRPWGMVIGVSAGTITGFYNLVRLLLWNQERKKK